MIRSLERSQHDLARIGFELSVVCDLRQGGLYNTTPERSDIIEQRWVLCQRNALIRLLDDRPDHI